jgi:hypothetical protein
MTPGSGPPLINYLKETIMKRIFTLCVILCTTLAGFAQTDSTAKQEPKADTIHIGGMVIIRDNNGKTKKVEHDGSPKMYGRNRDKPANLSTNWWILDLGFASYNDNSAYGSAATNAYAPGSNKAYFDLKDGKSVNVNIWIFMQRLNMVKHVLNLKYGLGLELNNYRYKQPVRYIGDPPPVPDAARVIYDNTPGRNYEKNKLAADYVTVPLMLNFNFTPNQRRGFGLSLGVSAGYLYSARNKTITSDEGKEKTKDDFEMHKWKLSYVGEISLGPVRFYGSYAFESMYERGLDMTPYTFGIRISNW